MQQLTLDVRIADYALFETYLAGPNDACVHALNSVARESAYAFIWIWGGAATGRSHLLQACVNEADATGSRSAYLPLDPAGGLAPAAADGLEACAVVCIDDVHRVIGDAEWERRLFMLYEGIRQRGGRLVISADRAPLHCQFGLPDLVSRFSSGATFHLRSLSDEERVSAMQLRAKYRGLELPNDVAHYVISRVARDTDGLFALLDRLDREALVAQRRLTIPFVREILAR